MQSIIEQFLVLSYRALRAFEIISSRSYLLVTFAKLFMVRLTIFVELFNAPAGLSILTRKLIEVSKLCFCRIKNFGSMLNIANNAITRGRIVLNR